MSFQHKLLLEHLESRKSYRAGDCAITAQMQLGPCRVVWRNGGADLAALLVAILFCDVSRRPGWNYHNVCERTRAGVNYMTCTFGALISTTPTHGYFVRVFTTLSVMELHPAHKEKHLHRQQLRSNLQTPFHIAPYKYSLTKWGNQMFLPINLCRNLPFANKLFLYN